MLTTLWLGVVSLPAEELRYLRFEPEPESPESTTAVSRERMRPSDDTPGPFIDNPRTRRSEPNEGSIFLRATHKQSQFIEITFDPKTEGIRAGIRSFTLELFVKATRSTKET